MRVTELVFRATDRGTVRTLDRIAGQSDKTARQLRRDSTTSAAGFERMSKSATRLRSTTMALGGAVGLGGLAFGIKSVTQAGIQWQSQQTQLQGALKNTGAYSKATFAALSSGAESLATRGGFDAAQNLQALTRFVTVTGNASKAQRDLGLTTNIARQTGFEFMRVQRAIMMLEAGRTTGLARLGIAIPKVTTAQDALRNSQLSSKDRLLQLEAAGVKLTAAQKAQLTLTNQVTPAMMAQAKAQDALASKQSAIALLTQKYDGAAGRFSRSQQGRIQNLQHAWENLKRTLGTALLPVVSRVVTVGAKVVTWLEHNKTILYGVLGAVAALTAAWVFNSIVTTIATTAQILFGGALVTSTAEGWAAVGATEGLSAASIALGIAMDTIPFLALIAGLVLIVTHAKQVRAAFNDAWQWIKGHWPLLAGILLAPITFGASIIVGLFHKQILGTIRSVIQWITGAWKKLTDILTWPFRQLLKAVQAVVGPIKSVGNTLGFGGHGVLSYVNPVGQIHHIANAFNGTASPHGSIAAPAFGGLSHPVNNAGQRILGSQGHIIHGQIAGQAADAYVPIVHVTNLDGKVIYKSTVKHALRRAARGPSSLVGGALTTG